MHPHYNCARELVYASFIFARKGFRHAVVGMTTIARASYSIRFVSRIHYIVLEAGPGHMLLRMLCLYASDGCWVHVVSPCMCALLRV